MFIAGFQKTTLLDYPNKIAALVFTQGCNFRCGYCHNPELLNVNSNAKPAISLEEFFKYLEKRKGKVDGVVITGGEPTLQQDLIEFIKDIKKLNYLVKLDSNGTSPQIIAELLDSNLIDYIAMDIKAPLNKYHRITNTIIDTSLIQQSIDLILNSNIDYEFRTTVIKSQLSFKDFEAIGELINGGAKYYLQKFVASKIYNKNLMNETTYSDEEFEEIVAILSQKISEVYVR